jgi:hypothetical protein
LLLIHRLSNRSLSKCSNVTIHFYIGIDSSFLVYSLISKFFFTTSLKLVTDFKDLPNLYVKKSHVLISYLFKIIHRCFQVNMS